MSSPDTTSRSVNIEEPVDTEQSTNWLTPPRLTVLAYAAAFAGAEAVGAFINIPLQAGLEAILLIIAVNHAVFGFRNRQTAGLVMSVLFASRLIAITLPSDSPSIGTRTAILAAVMIFAVSMAERVLGPDVISAGMPKRLHLKKPLVSARITTLAVAALGIPLGFAVASILDTQKIDVGPVAGVAAIGWGVLIAALVLGAAAEELVYRRLVAAMLHHTARTQAPWISGAIFAASYMGTGNAAMIGLMFVAGAIFAWSCERTGSLVGPITAHAIASVLALVVLAG